MTVSPMRLKAAGSLREALRTLIQRFEAGGGLAVEAEFGPAGLLRETIEAGADTDIFLSANLEHPRALAAIRGGQVVRFACNALCVLARPGLSISPETVLPLMLDPAVRVATSTPGNDPSGDYAFAMFDKADALAPGSGETLKRKALQLAGTRDPGDRKADGRTLYGHLLREGKADLFVSYLTTARLVANEIAGLQILCLPATLAIEADYGLLVLSDQSAPQEFADLVLSAEGQAILSAHGFAPARPLSPS